MSRSEESFFTPRRATMSGDPPPPVHPGGATASPPAAPSAPSPPSAAPSSWLDNLRATDWRATTGRLAEATASFASTAGEKLAPLASSVADGAREIRDGAGAALAADAADAAAALKADADRAANLEPRRGGGGGSGGSAADHRGSSGFKPASAMPSGDAPFVRIPMSSAIKLKLLDKHDLVALDAKHAEEMAEMHAEIYALRAVATRAMGGDAGAVDELVGSERDAASAALRTADDGVARVMLVAANARLKEAVGRATRLEEELARSAARRGRAASREEEEEEEEDAAATAAGDGGRAVTLVVNVLGDAPSSSSPSPSPSAAASGDKKDEVVAKLKKRIAHLESDFKRRKALEDSRLEEYGNLIRADAAAKTKAAVTEATDAGNLRVAKLETALGDATRAAERARAEAAAIEEDAKARERRADAKGAFSFTLVPVRPRRRGERRSLRTFPPGVCFSLPTPRWFRSPPSMPFNSD